MLHEANTLSLLRSTRMRVKAVGECARAFLRISPCARREIDERGRPHVLHRTCIAQSRPSLPLGRLGCGSSGGVCQRTRPLFFLSPPIAMQLTRLRTWNRTPSYAFASPLPFGQYSSHLGALLRARWSAPACAPLREVEDCISEIPPPQPMSNGIC